MKNVISSVRARWCSLLLVAGLMAMAPPVCADEAASPGADQASEKLIPGQFVHVALYTFKADAPPNTAAEFAAEAQKCFEQIDAVKSFRIGQPAAKSTPKEFMVGSGGKYDLGTVTTFENYAGMAQYGNDKTHNELKKKYAKYFDKIVTYDFESNPSGDSAAAEGSPVVGRVTLDGQPLGDGRIHFHLPGGESIGAKLKEDGTYSVQKLPHGQTSVSFSSRMLPAKYTDDERSGLVIQVNRGANTVDFELRSK